MLEKILIDVGRGLLIGAGLLVSIWLVLLLGLAMDIKEAAEQSRETKDE